MIADGLILSPLDGELSDVLVVPSMPFWLDLSSKVISDREKVFNLIM